MTEPADLRELAYHLECIQQREPSDLRAALIRAVASQLRAMAGALTSHDPAVPDQDCSMPAIQSTDRAQQGQTMP